MKSENKIKIINRAIDFLNTKVNTRISSALVEELSLLRKCYVEDVKNVSCDCVGHQACIICGDRKGLDGDFWKKMKENSK